MKLLENKARCNDLHNSLLKNNPLGEVENGHFVGRLVLDCELSEDIENVSVYEFRVDSLVNEFIQANHNYYDGKIIKESLFEAQTIIDDLKKMIQKIESHL